MRQTIWIAGLLALTALAGCVQDDGGGEGAASIYIKDAPTDEFDEVHVVISKVEVHFAGDDSSGDAANGTDGNETDGEWKTVFEDTAGVDVDLLDASGVRAAFLGEANLTAGKYTQVRVHFDEAYGIDKEGQRVAIDAPPTPGKVIQPFDVEAGMDTRIVIDLDLDRALKEQGPNGWILTPVWGETRVEVVEDSESGDEVHEQGEVAEV